MSVLSKELTNIYLMPDASYHAGSVTAADVSYAYGDPYIGNDQTDDAGDDVNHQEDNPFTVSEDATSDDVLTYVGENKEGDLFTDADDSTSDDVLTYVVENDGSGFFTADDTESDENDGTLYDATDWNLLDSGQQSDVNHPSNDSAAKEGSADEAPPITSQFSSGPGGFWVKSIGGGELKALGGIDFIKNVAKEYGISHGDSWEVPGVPWFHVEPNEDKNYPDVVDRDEELYLGSQSSDIVIGRSEGMDNYRVLLSYGDDIFIGSKLYENIMGSRGNDVVLCGGGRDEVSLALGDDVVFAGEGDSVGGGDGMDWYIYSDVTRIGKKFFHEGIESKSSQEKEPKDEGKVGKAYDQTWQDDDHHQNNDFYKCETPGNCGPKDGGNVLNDDDVDIYIDLGSAQNGYSFINERMATVVSFENVVAGKGDDVIYGDDIWGYGGNKLYGMEGNDELYGRAGQDIAILVNYLLLTIFIYNFLNCLV